MCIDFSMPDQAQLHFASASAFGTMVSTEDGGPFWRQRLMHLATRHLLQAPNGLDTRSMLSAYALTPTEIGRLLIASFVIASSGLISLGDTALSALADRIMLDFSRIYAEGSETNETMNDLGPLMFSVKELVLSAVVKLVAVAPSAVSMLGILCFTTSRRLTDFILLPCLFHCCKVAKYNSTLVPSLLHAYSDSCMENPMLVLPCKMLALQGLLNATEFLEQAKSTLLALKPVVVSVLSSAADNPSSALRQAAMDTRNAWYTLT